MGKTITLNFKVPLEYHWAEADIKETKFDDITAGPFREFVEQNSASICRIALYKHNTSKKAVAVGQLFASCPFCEEGKDQLLKSESWIEAHDWARSERLQSRWTNEEEVRNSLEAYSADPEVSVDVILDIPFFRNEDSLPNQQDFQGAEGENFYGFNISKALDDMNEGRGFIFGKEVGKRIAFGCFGGLFRCAHCGRVFAVAYSEGHMFDVPLLVERAISGMISTSKSLDLDDLQYLEDSSVVVARIVAEDKDGVVTLVSDLDSDPGELVFEIATGVTTLKGCSGIMDNHFILDKMRHNSWFELFTQREVVMPLRSILPRLPERTELCFSGYEDRGTIKWPKNVINLLMFVAANRFADYPASFYNSLVCEDRNNEFGLIEMALSKGFALPRKYSDLSMCYQMLDLPDDAYIKRAFLNKPILFVGLLSSFDLIFQDDGVLYEFFADSRAASYLRCMNNNYYSRAGWRKLVEAQGEETVLHFLESHTDEVISEMSLLLGKWAFVVDLTLLDEESLYEGLKELVERR